MSDALHERPLAILRAWRLARASLLGACVVSAASLFAAAAIQERDDDAIRSWSAARARDAATALRTRVQLFELAFERMARRQEFAPDPAAWQQDAERYRAGFPAIGAIAWHRADHGVRAMSPPDGLPVCVPPDDARESFHDAVEQSRARGALHWAMGRGNGESVLCVYAPVSSDDPRGDYFAAAATAAITAARFLPRRDDAVHYRVDMGSRAVYERGDTERPDFRRYAARVESLVGQVPIAITASPSPEQLAELRPETAVVVLLAGHLIAVLLGLAIFAGDRARRRAADLGEEVARRAEMEGQLDLRAQELEIARDAARAASLAKSGFLANMSHEIRTPLNAVIGLTEALLRSDLDEQQRDHLETVISSSEALLGVINDILDFSKIEAGKLDLERVAFDLHDTVGDTLKSLAMLVGHKNLELVCYIDPDLPERLVGDPSRLRQVLTNLVSNSIKFTERGEIVVRVETEQVGDGFVTVYFSVRDSGIGIPSEIVDRLFESFEQADHSTTRRYGGSGLGLAICRQLVALMGGRLGAESAPGQGSTFHFTARFGVSREKPEPARHERLRLAGTRVLIVDDNPTNRAILEELARAKRMLPVTAASAAEALDRLREAAGSAEPIQLLLSDVHMPGTDGFELVRQIRSDSRLDPLVIVFLTSAGETGDLARCEALGVAARLVKPVKQLELFEVMARTLGRAEALTDPTDPLDLSRPEEFDLPPLRILLVEDSVANQKVALVMLDESRHDISVAGNGRTAVEQVAAQEFDLVLMDVEMPEMDGFEATAAIRAAESGTGRRIPIIAMTAHALTGTREKCLDAGMDDFVSKPVRREQLLRALAGALKRRNARRLPRRGDDRARPGDAAALGAPVIDWADLLDQVGGRPESLRGLCVTYAAELREHLPRLAAFVGSGDADETRRRAHTLAGALRRLGAREAHARAILLEEIAERGTTQGAERVLGQLSDATERVATELDRFIRSGRVPE